MVSTVSLPAITSPYPEFFFVDNNLSVSLSFSGKGTYTPGKLTSDNGEELTSPPKVSMANSLSPLVPQSHVEQSGYVIIGKLKDGNLNFLILLNNTVNVAAAAAHASALRKNGAANNAVAPKLKADPVIAATPASVSCVAFTIDKAIKPINIAGAKLFHKNLTI